MSKKDGIESLKRKAQSAKLARTNVRSSGWLQSGSTEVAKWSFGIMALLLGLIVFTAVDYHDIKSANEAYQVVSKERHALDATQDELESELAIKRLRLDSSVDGESSDEIKKEVSGLESRLEVTSKRLNEADALAEALAREVYWSPLSYGWDNRFESDTDESLEELPERMAFLGWLTLVFLGAGVTALAISKQSSIRNFQRRKLPLPWQTSRMEVSDQDILDEAAKAFDECHRSQTEWVHRRSDAFKSVITDRKSALRVAEERCKSVDDSERLAMAVEVEKYRQALSKLERISEANQRRSREYFDALGKAKRQYLYQLHLAILNRRTQEVIDREGLSESVVPMPQVRLDMKEHRLRVIAEAAFDDDSLEAEVTSAMEMEKMIG